MSLFAPRTCKRARPGAEGSWKDAVGMSALSALTAFDVGAAVGREGSCERMLRGLLWAGSLVAWPLEWYCMRFGCGGGLTLMLGWAQRPGERFERALVVMMRRRAQKRSVNSVC